MTNILILGFLLGMRHALEADHVAAVAALASQNLPLKRAVRTGAVWGVGHTLTLFIFGSIALLLNNTIPESLSNWLEFAVGIMLVILGADVLRRLIRDRVHFHTHRHGFDVQHFHAHSHRDEKLSPIHPRQHTHTHSNSFTLRAFFIGMMHGMAGSAVLIVLASQAMSSLWMGMIYILLFGFGSIFGMAALSAIIAVPIHKTRSVTWFHNGLQVSIGILTIGLGGATILAHA